MVKAEDIARMTGVSRSSVSAVLSGTAEKRRIGRTTIEKVLAAARKAGYQPNVLASNLRRGRTHSIGILIPSPEDSVYAGLVGQLNTLVSNAGYFATFAFWNTMDEQRRAAESILRRQPEGIITVEPKHIPKTNTCPVVSFIVEDPRFDNITFDRIGIVRRTIEYLTGLGHERIANPYVSLTADTEKDYRAASEFLFRDFGERGISCEWLNNIAFGSNPWIYPEISRKITDWLLSYPKKKRPTALILYTDLLAAHVIRELLCRGVRIPKDISIIGCDNVSFASLLSPSLTTFGDDPEFPMAEMLVKRLFFRMENPEAPIERILVPRKLYLRESCANIENNPKKGNEE